MTAKKLLKLAERHWQDDSFDDWRESTELKVHSISCKLESDQNNRKFKKELSDLREVQSLIKYFTLERTFIYDKTRIEEQKRLIGR